MDLPSEGSLGEFLAPSPHKPPRLSGSDLLRARGKKNPNRRQRRLRIRLARQFGEIDDGRLQVRGPPPPPRSPEEEEEENKEKENKEVASSGTNIKSS